ncbi:uncharacterized protein BO87DRAFT_400203 [Aspergillus neoniger CBS 115656]|uniref:Uncharacterized protein n=1 Tax=Aspergillus neoniger (strain CBS 115656) TaxID=1448310 RepID=A0A318Z0W3_ASPNB|nr:hypothetical protein BO87DRAFT_400203 [Aspergillus neoniger CBS 115656]PYH30732.1 hypothetical protein BO87DRAFT_400203 [Aspergillus neoniger CBS 115656]
MKVAYPKTTTDDCKTIGEVVMLQTILDESSSASVEPANRRAYRLAEKSRCSGKNGRVTSRGPSAVDSTCPLADNSGKGPIESGTTLDWL